MLPACGLLMSARSTIPVKPPVAHLTLAAGGQLAYLGIACGGSGPYQPLAQEVTTPEQIG